MSRVVEMSRGLIDRMAGLLRLRADEAPKDGGRPKATGPKRSGPPGPGLPNGQGQPQSRGLFTMVAVIALMVLLFMMFSAPNRAEPITLQQFRIEYEEKRLTDVRLTDEGLKAKRKKDISGPEGYVMVPINSVNKELIAKEANDITKGDFQNNSASVWLTVLVFFGPLVFIVVLGWWLVSRGLRAAAGGGGMLGNFGKSRHRTLTKEMTGVTFADVAGIDEAKDEVTEIIEFLKNPKKFTKLGGRIPRGVLLVGEPGCGKTLLAKAIAGEADVPFFSISGSDFVEMFVGVGASRVRDLFKQAKDSAPCIIFLDEIDAVGRRRGGGFTTGGHDEREQTLNAILVEMDGFNTTDGVIVIAATNRNDVLDPALTRPGRFDRQITVPLPDVKGRLEILRVHSKKVKMGPNVELERIARGTPMFSGADLAAIINEAAIAATMQNKDFIEHEDLEEARDKVKFGRAKKSRVREKDENKLVAFHEAGHAILQALLTDADPLHKVTIIPRGGAGGATFSLPEKDRMGYGIKWLNATMRVLCGGRIAEQKAMNDASSGASMDITQVTSLARTMIVEWGMSRKLGFVRYAGMDTREMYMSEKSYSEETAKQIDEEVRRFVDEAFADAQRILEENWDKVVRVADALIKYETLSADDVHRLMRGEELAKPTVADLLRSEAARRKADATPAVPPEATPDLPPGAMPNPA
ncbi:MAG: ATP-dependent zinc metalloprotease FtsH [Phycisphaerales bacterium]